METSQHHQKKSFNSFHNGHTSHVFQSHEQHSARPLAFHTYKSMMSQLVFMIPMCSFHDVNVFQLKNGKIDTLSSVHHQPKTFKCNFFQLVLFCENFSIINKNLLVQTKQTFVLSHSFIHPSHSEKKKTLLAVQESERRSYFSNVLDRSMSFSIEITECIFSKQKLDNIVRGIFIAAYCF